jgi:hypothetical protein
VKGSSVKNEQIRDVIIESGLQLIPYVGGSIATAYFGTKQEKRIARLESFYQEVAEQIENMQAQLAAIREHDEEYLVVIIEELNEHVEREQTAQKRTILKNYFINMLKQPITADNFDEHRYFLGTIKAMSLLECDLIGWLYNQNRGHKISKISITGIDPYAIAGAVQRLRQYGFIISVTTQITVGAQVDNLLGDEVRLSDFGRKFYRYCILF